MDDHAVNGAQIAEHGSERFCEFGCKDPKHLTLCSSRVCQGAKYIEYRADADLPARANGEFHRRVEEGGKEEAEV